MIKKTFSLIIFFNFLYGALNAQIYVEEKAIYDEAEEYLDGEEYEEALPLYKLLEKRGILNSNISYKIGFCYLQMNGRKSRAVPYLENAVQNVSENYNGNFEELNAPVESWIYLGKAYHMQTDFEKARLCFNKIPQISKDTGLINLAGFLNSKTELAELFILNPTEAKKENLQSDSDFSVYNPLYLKEESFVLMERRKFYDAIITCNLNSNVFHITDNITPMVGSDGNIFICGGSADGNILIFKGYNAGKGYDLYFSERLEQGKWGKYKRFPEPVNSVFNESSAFMDGNVLYFTSNRTGTFGGEDIYESMLDKDGNWTEPKNLGRSVNTMFDESSPFYSTDSRILFFSSKGHQNMGGYDLFFSENKANGDWSPAINMGSPFSTTSDDDCFSKKTNENMFYTARYNSPDDEQSRIINLILTGNLPQKRVMVTGNLTFSDSIKAKPVNYSVKSNETLTISAITDADGSYTLFLLPGEYSLNFSYADNIFAEQRIEIQENQMADELNLIPPTWKSVRTSEELNVEKPVTGTDITVLYIKDILFDFNSSNLSGKYSSLLDSLAGFLAENQSDRIVIIGHTDAVGNENYNLKLSQERARVVANYLQTKGVKSSQVSFKGKGEVEPVALNTFKNGTDNPDGRKFNRRVELQLITSGENVQVIHIQSIPDNIKVK